jgi:hypothetical protein
MVICRSTLSSYLCWHERTEPTAALLLRIYVEFGTFTLSGAQQIVSLQLYALCLEILK